MHDLAIVIPAYKIDFFEETLKSLTRQSCKDFTVYVGDDCSPSNFEELVLQYQDRLDIVYKKFESNLGGENLVAQWTRCIEMTQSEPWIWLFSDDDVMGDRCVELFYKRKKNDGENYLYHFDVKVIDSSNRVIKDALDYPPVITSEDFYCKKGCARLDSFVVEYVFSRKVYESVDGFQSFDLAWGSDIATWCKMGKDGGIHTIMGDFVFWRKSEKNITPDLNRSMARRKFRIDMDYFMWAKHFFGTKKIDLFTKYFLFRNFVFYSNSLTFADCGEILNVGVENAVISNYLKKIVMLMYPIVKVLKKIKGILRK